MSYHTTVLLHEGVEALNVKPDGVYVDVTFGGGGHSKLILDQLGPSGRLLGFDQDADAKANDIKDDRFTLCESNFRFLSNFLDLHGIETVDAVLADLGVSGFQFDEGSRGFSFRFEADLDMRMNTQQSVSAQTVLNEYSVDELKRVFRDYGETRFGGKLARVIEQAREENPIKTIQDFQSLIERCVPPQKRGSELAKIFQAVRIEVNDELGALKAMLEQSSDRLASGGRLVVISYHSLEDRLVKYFLRSGNFDDVLDKDFYGNVNRPLDPVSGKAAVPSEEEITRNPRSRSAKMRIAIKR